MSQIPLPASAKAEQPDPDDLRDDRTVAIVADVAYRRFGIVNVVLIGRERAGDGRWVLIDTGIAGSAAAIRSAARERFGGSGRPACIVITHGHFDHVGALEALANEWDVPVYAHPAEQPYLNGTSSYPPPDPSVGLPSPAFPTRPVNVAPRLHSLPADHSVPFTAEWTWIATPGHSPGHVSLWRPRDRVLIAGDAFVTTRPESVYAAVTQAPEMHGPPVDLTTDWASAKQSVQKLAALQPELVITGHGAAMGGAGMRTALDQLADRFDTIAVPRQHEQPA